MMSDYRIYYGELDYEGAEGYWNLPVSVGRTYLLEFESKFDSDIVVFRANGSVRIQVCGSGKKINCRFIAPETETLTIQITGKTWTDFGRYALRCVQLQN